MKIYVVGSSKNKFLPLDDIREKFLIDQKHEGDNIDFLNPWYCELTGLYYLWKHVDDDIVGLEHYRRYFVNDKGNLLSENEIRDILKNYDVITPIHHPNPSVESIVLPQYKPFYKHFILIAEKQGFVEYAKICNEVLNSNTMCLCNMCICSKELLNEYCDFIFNLFSTLNEFETFCKRTIPNRMFGWISESLFRAYLIYKNKKIKFQNIKFVK